MAILTRDQFFDRIREHIGDDASDESISFMEDITDTYNDMETRAAGDGVDWEQRYKDLDENWKKRYTHRFFSSGGGNPFSEGTDMEDDTVKAAEKAAKIRIDDLFK